MASRERWAKWLESKGGEWRNSVTKRTSVLIVGEEPGRDKIEKSQRYGVVTLHWYMMVHLGLVEERGNYRLPIDENIITDLVIIMASIAEDYYGQARAGHDGAARAFDRASLAIESLLQAAYGESRGTATP